MSERGIKIKSMTSKCYICGTEFEGEMFVDNCPCCGWIPADEEMLTEDEYDTINYTSIKEAKANYAKGLNKWGEPIKTK